MIWGINKMEITEEINKDKVKQIEESLEENKIKEIKKICESLKKNTMFNLSLSSKELFHSNFIAWLIENYPNNMNNIFNKVLKIVVDHWLQPITIIDNLSFSVISLSLIYSSNSEFNICPDKICFLQSIFSFGKL